MRHVMAILFLCGCQFDPGGLAAYELGGDRRDAGQVDLVDVDGSGPADAGVGPDGAPPDGAVADGPFPDSVLADAAGKTDVGGCWTVSLVASKSYDPSVWTNAAQDFTPDAVQIALPATLSATQGNGANHCSILAFEHQGSRTECAYKGGATTSHVGSNSTQIQLGLTYHFAQCREGTQVSFQECVGSNSGTATTLQAGDTVTAARIELQVNGDSELDPTEVTLPLQVCAP